ncbi:hypothetical protein BDW69DRAFT_197119 [Aspergillus filifer]
MPLIFNGGNRSSSNDIPTWNLGSCSSEVPRDVQHFKYLNDSPSQRDDDDRSPVNRRDILPGAKYRAIAKLFLRYENSEEDTWNVATGFLVRDDLVVTAGHCVYDWNYDLGELTEVKVFIGYTGRQNVENPEVEFRVGKSVATTPDWMEKGGRKEADLAFIKLNRPFDDVTPFRYRNTPTNERTQIGVMLEHNLDNFGGCHGAPILDENLNCIGVHTYGGRQNCATVIGRQGHPFEPYIDALDAMDERGERGGRYERQRRQYQPQHRGRGEEQELVSQILKLVRDFPSAIPQNILLPDTRLSLGQLGVPAGAVTNIALSAATNAVMDNVDTSDYKFDKHQAFNGIAERAILAEAALIAVQEMSTEMRQDEQIFETITQTVIEFLPTIQQSGSTVINSAQEPILRLALDEVRKNNRGGYRSRSDSIPSFRQSRGTSRRGLSGKKASFVDSISEGARDERTERFVTNVASEALDQDAEVKWDQLDISRQLRSSTSSIIEGGRRQSQMTGPLLTGKGQYNQGQYQRQQGHHLHGYQGQQVNLHTLDQILDMDVDDDQFPLSVECLPLRAVVGEAALQAIMHIPHQQLEQEGLFEVMRDVIRQHGPTVMKVAPAVIRKVAPVFTAISQEEYGYSRQYGYGRTEYGRGGRQRRRSPQRFRIPLKAKALAKRKAFGGGMGMNVSPAEQDFLQAF